MATGSRHTVLATARQKFRAGVTIAAVPIGTQIAIAALIWMDGSPFPKADKAFERPAFWFMQMILLCISVGGNTLVDFNAAADRRGLNQASVHNMFFCFCIVLVAVVVSMLNSDINYLWLGLVLIFGFANLFLAYRIEMELALSAAGLLE
jgi:hypothetical protein